MNKNPKGTRIMCVGAVLATVCLAVAARGANIWWVDVNATSAEETGAENEPFRTIQAAIDAASANDTVKVRPGLYAEGLTDDPTDTGRSRVFIDKPITLVSTAGRDKTEIRGAFASSSAALRHSYGMGSDAIRGIYVSENAANASAVTRIEGFTISCGASMYDSKDTTAGAQLRRNMGGGIAVIATDGAAGHENCFIVDCAITNCVATRAGGVFSGTSVRTLFRGNKAVRNGAAARDGSFYNCLIAENANVCAIAYATYVVNCTFRKNTSGLLQSTVYNCLFDNNTADAGSGDGVLKIYSSATTKESWVVNPKDKVSACGIATPVYASPAPEVFGDCGLVTSPECIAHGDVSCLSKIPEEFRGTDYNGRLRTTSDEVAIGAGEPFPAVGGPFRIESAGVCVLTGDGVAYPCAAGDLFFATNWPVQYKITAPNKTSEHVVRIRTYKNGSESSILHRRVLDRDGFAYFTPSSDPATTYGVNVEYSGAYYVDVNAGSDETGDGTSEKPYKTIQYASDRCGYGTVYVRPGVYTPANQGVHENSSGIRGTLLRTNGWAQIVATGTPGETVIEGAPEPDVEIESYPYGCGPNAVRAIYTTGNVLFRGFTIRNGYTATVSDATGRGGGVYAESGNCLLVDCVISNCAACQCGAGYGNDYSLVLDRCRVSNVRSYDSGSGAINCATVANSTFANSRGTRMFGSHVKAYNASVSNPLNVPFWPGSNLFLYNSIAESSAGDTSASTAMGAHDGSLFWGFKYDLSGLTWADAYLRDPLNGDFSVAFDSPARTTGTYRAGDWCIFARSDVNNVPYSQAWKQGLSYAGAAQSSFSCVHASCSGSRDGTTTGAISPSGLVAVTPGETVTFTATEGDTRRFLHFLVNGEVAESSDGTYAYSVPSDGLSSLELKAVYLKDWHVDDDGDDGNTGVDPEHAMKTLAAVLPKTIAGDVVHLAEGRYTEGDMIQATAVKTGFTPTIRARAVVPERVTLVGAGPDKTFVCGQDATAPDVYGCGTDAVRGVFLDSYAVLSNLTVCAGRTNAGSTEDDDNHGGGILARNDTAITYGCVISNNVAPRAGGARYGTCVHCRFLENKATVNGSAARDVNAYECFLDGNRGSAVINYPKTVYGCTFGADNTLLTGLSTASLGGLGKGCVLRNCLFANRGGTSMQADADLVIYSNCVFNATSKDAYHLSPESGNCVTATVAELVFDAQGAPVIGQNAAVDAADSSVRGKFLTSACDASGNPRISNARMDIGCYEADWKPRYAVHLYRRNVAVSSVPGEAQLSESGLLLPKGELASTWRNASAIPTTFELPVAVTGAGTLTVSVDGTAVATVTSGTSPANVLFTLPQGEHSIAFTYAVSGEEDAGLGAVLSSAHRRDGLYLILR